VQPENSGTAARWLRYCSRAMAAQLRNLPGRLLAFLVTSRYVPVSGTTAYAGCGIALRA
jgi:hypothetical protein